MPEKPFTEKRSEMGAGVVPESLWNAIYDDLKRLAANQLRREPAAHSLQATALVHEAWLRLEGQASPWQSRTHFVAVASEMMRRVLVDHARARLRQKRGAGAEKVSLSEANQFGAGKSEVEILDLDRALDRLADADPRKARLVELHCFGGLNIEEIATYLGVSLATAERDWRFARAFLRKELGGRP